MRQDRPATLVTGSASGIVVDGGYAATT